MTNDDGVDTPKPDPLRAVLESLRMDLDVATTWFTDAERYEQEGEARSALTFREMGEHLLRNAIGRARSALKQIPQQRKAVAA